jgi:DNA-binding transcriptional ArsR family regulator
MATATAIKRKVMPATAKVRREAAVRLEHVHRVAVLFKQASDPTRLQVITMLSRGERHVGSLCAALSQNPPAVIHHLALLRHGGIIIPRRSGQNNFYRLTDTGRQLAQLVEAVGG